MLPGRFCKLAVGCDGPRQVMPQWVTQPLDRTTSSKNAGGGRYRSGTSSNAEDGAGNFVDLLRRQRDEFSWTARISQHTKCGEGTEALRIFREMQEVGVTPNSYTFVAALKACSSLQDLESAKQIHTQVVRSGLETVLYVGNMLVDVYAKCGSLVDARRVFENMPHRDVVSWNSMILGYAQMEEGEVALQLYARMQQEGIVPNGRTAISALKACSSLAARDEGKEADGKRVNQSWLDQVRAIHSDVVKNVSEPHVFVGNLLVDVYAKCGSLVEARHVFDKMPHRDVVSWTAMILGYAQTEQGGVALQLYKQMQQEGLVPNDRTFVGALKACSSLAALEEGILADGKLVKEQCLRQVRAIHVEILKCGFESALYVGTMLVDAYAKCGSLVDARQVFEKMPLRTVVSWNAIILGHTQLNEGKEALQLYTQMQIDGVVPNDRTFIGALKACGCIAGLEKGKEIHAEILSNGLEVTDSFVSSSLIDMYGKCGSMVDAQQVFDASPTRDVVTWSALISGYARQGESQIVFDLFEMMTQEGIHPDSIIFLSLLSACSHAGLVDKGKNYFEAMRRDYGITPTIDHHTCVIDLFGRAGQVDKAMAMVKAMPFQPDAAVWRTMLNACQKWRNVELGREAFEYAVRLDKNDAAAYVFMSNIYAGAHMLEDAKQIQEIRVGAQVRKQPGQSWWTDVRGVAHAFEAGDQEHHENQEIYLKLDHMFVRMKEEEYSAHPDSVLRSIANYDVVNAPYFNSKNDPLHDTSASPGQIHWTSNQLDNGTADSKVSDFVTTFK